VIRITELCDANRFVFSSHVRDCRRSRPKLAPAAPAAWIRTTAVLVRRYHFKPVPLAVLQVGGGRLRS